MPTPPNTLYYGDNLAILREYIADASIDLVYLDPPFNSNRTYNVLFRDESGKESEAQIAAFEDTWHWSGAVEAYHELVTGPRPEVGQMIAALRGFIGENQMMAYLVMMAIRLVELHRALKPTGSLYLHCDPTASHYLKVVLDTIFGPENFVNEISWQRTATKGDVRRKYGAVHDVLLFYSRSLDNYVFHSQFSGQDAQAYRERFTFDDGDGRGPYQSAPLDSPNPRPNLTYVYKGYLPPAKGWRVSLEVMEQLDKDMRLIFPPNKAGRIRRKVYFREVGGPKIGDVWTDIPPLQAVAAERLGYPTQKPVALLERIVAASSNEGDVTLDPFCGCGTTIAAAHKLNRRWIGIDVTHLSIALQKYRLKDAFDLTAGKDYAVVGEPADVGAAAQLAQDDRYQFQWWALSLIQARPLGGDSGGKKGKKGADQGIDGVIAFIDDTSQKPKRLLVQVKSGHVNSATIRDLVGTLTREQAPMGVLITLEPPSGPMLKEAASAGFYHSPGWQQKYPRLQILTIEQLLHGAKVDMPPTSVTFKQAQREAGPSPHQPGLGLDV